MFHDWLTPSIKHPALKNRWRKQTSPVRESVGSSSEWTCHVHNQHQEEAPKPELPAQGLASEGSVHAVHISIRLTSPLHSTKWVYLERLTNIKPRVSTIVPNLSSKFVCRLSVGREQVLLKERRRRKRSSSSKSSKESSHKIWKKSQEHRKWICSAMWKTEHNSGTKEIRKKACNKQKYVTLKKKN